MRKSLMNYCVETGCVDLLSQWEEDANKPLTPREISWGSRRAVWWRCEKGHEWSATVTYRTRGGGCPYCSGRRVLVGFNDLASQNPDLAQEWRDPELKPEDVTVFSNRWVQWECELGHSYSARIADRTGRGSGCPYCAGRKVLPGFNDMASAFPQLAKEWHPTLNKDLKPEEVTCGSHKKVWWECSLGHVWKAVVYSRTSGYRSGCPVCAGKVKGNILVPFGKIPQME